MNLRICLIATLVATLFSLPALAGEELRYSGSSTIGTGILQAGAVSAFETKTGIKLAAIEQPGSGKGIQALVEGKATVAGVSRALHPEEKKQKLIATIIGYDAIAVFVHKNNPVQGLTKEQIKGIYTGQIKNWKEVGGSDAPITAYAEILTGKRATTEMLHEMVLDGAAFGAGVKEIDLPRDLIVKVSGDEKGICCVSLGLLSTLSSDIKDKVKVVTVNGIEPAEKNVRSGAYMISRPLLLVTKGLAKGEPKEFINFMLSSEGQGIVARNFVPVRK